MSWLEAFANSLYFHVFGFGFGLLLLLMAPHRRMPTADEIGALPRSVRWLLLHPWERWSGWTMIVVSVGMAAFKLTHRNVS